MKITIRDRIFYGFIIVALLSIIGVTMISYFILKDASEKQDRQKLQQSVETLMSSLDYAVSRTYVTPENIASVLDKKILEISDVNKQDIIIYNLKGEYLLSNKDEKYASPHKIPDKVLREIISSDRYDSVVYDKGLSGDMTSSYIKLLNNMLEPIAIVYFPFYHNNSSHLEIFNRYFQIMIGANIFIIGFGLWLSWKISYSITRNIRKISERIVQTDLGQLEIIRYPNQDEFTPLVNSYNKTIKIIDEQKNLLAMKEKESAWKEMAKQVAHEVKNPLTPMKLLIQNFERKFDKNDPDIDEKVTKLSQSLVAQIDLIAKVAGAFSEFTKLPQKRNEVFNVNQEIRSLIQIFDGKKEIFFQEEQEHILIHLDKSFFQRILTNLILNAQQAKDENKEKLAIFIKLKLLHKKIQISVEDNGVGVPEDRLTKIFEPNFTTKSSGTGLGLAMVKKMVEEYRGEVSIRSTLGKGTEISFTLPTNL